jgi:hypothetical protein
MGRSTKGTLALLALGIVCTFRIVCDLPALGKLLSPIVVMTTDVSATTTMTTTNEEIYPTINRMTIQTEQNRTAAAENPPNKSKNQTLDLFHLFQEYANWHAEQLQELGTHPDSWTNHKYSYLVMECRTPWNADHNDNNTTTQTPTPTPFGPACGGLADRLKPFPLVLWAAAKSRRIFFISWNRPFGLESFLEPPPSASIPNSDVLKIMEKIDWRVPKALSRRGFHDTTTLPARGVTIEHEKSVYPCAMQPNIQILRTKIQSPGEHTFIKKTGGVVYADIYSQLWHSLFRLVPRLEQKMNAHLESHQLVPDQYVAIHLRLQYPTSTIYGQGPNNSNNNKKQQTSRAQVTQATTHALQCASVAYPGAPIFVATDSPGTVRPVVQDLVQMFHKKDPEMRIRIVMLPPHHAFNTTTNTTIDQILHLDRDRKWQRRTPDEYDSIFVDLYLLGQARCVLYGHGGYGKFGSLLSSGAATCGLDVSATQLPCPWTLGNGTTTILQESSY